MTTIGTYLYTAFKGQLVGSDEYGNKYYEAKSEKISTGHKKRWVLYKGMVEPSKIPPIWHGWMHYTTDQLPQKKMSPAYSWMKESLPNLTGTPLAYVPPGHITRGAERAVSMADYEAWKP